MEITLEPKNRSASGFTCRHHARGEPDLTSELLGEASEIKSEGNDLTERLLVMRQKIDFFFLIFWVRLL